MSDMPGGKKLPLQPLLPEVLDKKTERALRWMWEELARYLNSLAIQMSDPDPSQGGVVKDANGNLLESTFCVPLTDAVNLNSNAADVAVVPPKIFRCQMNNAAPHFLVNPTNAKCGQELRYQFVNNSNGAISFLLDSEFRDGEYPWGTPITSAQP